MIQAPGVSTPIWPGPIFQKKTESFSSTELSKFEFKIEMEFFETWLTLFFETIVEIFKKNFFFVFFSPKIWVFEDNFVAVRAVPLGLYYKKFLNKLLMLDC